MNRDLKENLRRVARLEDVVRRYQPLQRAGSSENSLLGMCPFHPDRHPSLHVHVGRQYYKCFACGEGGDLFKYVMRQEGCSFPEALEKLAGWYGITPGTPLPPMPQRTGKVGQMQQKPSPAFTPSERDCQYRQNRLMLDSLKPYVPGEACLRATYRLFEVGESSAFVPPGFERMANRLVFPVRDAEGRLAGFAARCKGTPDGNTAKYVNSANSAVYQKGELLYGLYQAGEAIRRHGFVYLTEGYKDTLAMHAAGFCNTVALAGTALTSDHIALLARYTTRAVVLLDGDRSGQEAARRTALLLRSAAFTVSCLTLEPRHDPDSLLLATGAASFVSYIRAQTRYCRLETYEATLSLRIAALLHDLPLALTSDERNLCLTQLMRERHRLARATERLGHGVVRLLFQSEM